MKMSFPKDGMVFYAHLDGKHKRVFSLKTRLTKLFKRRKESEAKYQER